MSRNVAVAVVSAAAAVLLCAGCVHNVYYLGEKGGDTPIPPADAAGIWVDTDPDAATTPQDADVKRKIHMLLRGSGYRTVPEDEADLFLFFEYSVDSVLGRIYLEPMTGMTRGVETVRREGPFEHSLSLWLLDAEAYRDGQREEMLWLGGSKLAQAPTESSRFLDMLLIAAFKEFPQETEGTLRAKMRLNDPRARRLRQPAGG
jgi:hypothetical protein